MPLGPNGAPRRLPVPSRRARYRTDDQDDDGASKRVPGATISAAAAARKWAGAARGPLVAQLLISAAVAPDGYASFISGHVRCPEPPVKRAYPSGATAASLAAESARGGIKLKGGFVPVVSKCPGCGQTRDRRVKKATSDGGGSLECLTLPSDITFRHGQTQFRRFWYVAVRRETAALKRRPRTGVVRSTVPDSAITHQLSTRLNSIPAFLVRCGHTRDRRVEMATSDGGGSLDSALCCHQTSPSDTAKYDSRVSGMLRPYARPPR